MEFRFSAGQQFEAESPLRLDLLGMGDFFLAHGININVSVGLSANLYATFRDDDMVKVHSGQHGIYEMSLSQIYGRDDHEQMFPKALKMYPDCRLVTGLDLHIDCQYGAGGLSTSSSVAAAIHAFLERIFDRPLDAMGMVWRVIRTEPHCYGRQDQLAAVCGGFNMWEMFPDEFNVASMRPITFNPNHIRQKRILCTKERLSQLERVILVYESGIREGAGGILREVAQAFLEDPVGQQKRFDRLNELAEPLRQCLEGQTTNATELADCLGPILSQVRHAHAALHPDVMNARMEDLFQAALDAGATGGRINGAGRRGTIQLAVPPHLRAEVQHRLNQVDTPGPGSKQKTRGELIEIGGFGTPGARCWPVH